MLKTGDRFDKIVYDGGSTIPPMVYTYEVISMNPAVEVMVVASRFLNQSITVGAGQSLEIAVQRVILESSSI